MSLVDFKVKGGIDIPDGYTMVEEKIFDVSTDNWNMTETLDGDTDKGYIIDLHYYNVTGSNCSVGLTVNGGTSMSTSRIIYSVLDHGTENCLQNTGIQPAINANSGSRAFTRFFIPISKTSLKKPVIWQDNRHFDTNNILIVRWAGQISVPDTSTKITGFGVESITVPNALGAGTTFRCYKLG
jgi:hypothetical protein